MDLIRDPRIKVSEKGILEKVLLRYGSLPRLSLLSDQLAFFTPAPLYLSGWFRDDQLIDFLCEYRPIDFYHRKFTFPLFRGLETRTGDPAWNHVLWAVERPHWEPLLNFLVSVKLVDEGTRTIWGCGAQDLAIVDPEFADQNPVLPPAVPLLDITAFGINGSQHCYAFAVGPNPVFHRPTLRQFPPEPEALVFAEAFWAGANPVDALDRFLIQQSESEEPTP